MKKLNEFMMSALARKGLRKGAEGALICYYAQELGQCRFEAVSFSNGILKVSVTSSSAAQVVQIESEKIIKELNEKIGREVVRTLRIVNRG